MSASDYKTAKEAFVSGMTGSSIGHINLVSAVALSSIALHSALRARSTQAQPSLLMDYTLLVLPLLLSMTLFAERPILLNILLLAPTAVLALIPAPEKGTPLPSNHGLTPSRPSSPEPRLRTPSMGSVMQSSESVLPAQTAPATNSVPPLPALTTWRAHMLIMTILAILAVDFPVFPRALAKCETYGTSLMDIGVGSFVFSQGVVSALPIIKDPGYLTAPALPKLVTVTRKVMPVLALGLVRVILVKGVDYPEHVSEYGAHWNFFVTLGLLPILQVALHPLISRFSVTTLGVSLALLQQLVLSYLGGASFVLDAPRTNVISANKEGIVSLLGYFAIHVLGLSLGTVVLPAASGHFKSHRRRGSDSDSDEDEDEDARPTPKVKRRARRRDTGKIAIELCSYAIVWWTLVGVCSLAGAGADTISRRMVNLPYVLWIAAFNTSFVLGYLLIEMHFFPGRAGPAWRAPQSGPLAEAHTQTAYALVPPALGRRRSGSGSGEKRRANAGWAKLEVPRPRAEEGKGEGKGEVGAPALLEAVNRNGLALFLVANLATGVTNMVLPTMYVRDAWAMAVLGGYSFGICAVAWAVRGDRIWKL